MPDEPYGESSALLDAGPIRQPADSMINRTDCRSDDFAVQTQLRSSGKSVECLINCEMLREKPCATGDNDTQ
jgi:hypothetical protein